MGRWTFLASVWLNRSTFDEDMSRKRFLHFRSQWPSPLDIKFKFAAVVTVVQRYVTMFLLNQNYLRLSWFKKIGVTRRTDRRTGATVNATCSLDESKKKFYRAANGIGKIGRVASEEVILHLISSKCLPILLYVLESLPLYQYQLNSIDFVINRFFMKLSKTTDMYIPLLLCRKCLVLSYRVFSLLVVLVLWNLSVSLMKVTAYLVRVILVISWVYVATMFMVNKRFI